MEGISDHRSSVEECVRTADGDPMPRRSWLTTELLHASFHGTVVWIGRIGEWWQFENEADVIICDCSNDLDAGLRF